MRILQVSAHFPAHGGGIEIVAGWLARQLSKAGLDVCWMAGGAPDEWPSDLPPAVTVVHARAVDLLEKRLGLPAPIWALSSLRQLYRLVGQADVVHIHDFLYMPTLVAAAFAAVHAKPLVITQHIGLIPFKSRLARGVLGLLNRSLGRWMLTHADRVVFVGRPVQSYFERFVQFRRAPRLIPNGVDHLQFQPGEQGRVSDAVQLLFVGRFVEKKGLSLLRQVLGPWTAVTGSMERTDAPCDGPRKARSGAGRRAVSQCRPLGSTKRRRGVPAGGSGSPCLWNPGSGQPRGR